MDITAGLHDAIVSVGKHVNLREADEASALHAYTDNLSHLSPEALIMYLQGRLTSLDNQINEIFERQQKIEAVRQKLNELNKLIASGDTQEGKHTNPEFMAQLNQCIEELKKLDPKLGSEVQSGLQKRHFIASDTTDNSYWGHHIAQSTDYINTIIKQLESNAQMDMIKLQSLSSARANAIQMSTNLVASFSEGLKSIAGNIR